MHQHLLLSFLCLLLITSLSANANEFFRCSNENFCSDFLVNHYGVVGNRSVNCPCEKRVDGQCVRYQNCQNSAGGQYYYGAIIVDLHNGSSNTATYRDSGVIETRSDSSRKFDNQIKNFRGAFRAEGLAKNACHSCDTIISFRSGCAAVAWSPSSKRYYRTLIEYNRDWKPIKTTGRNANVLEIEDRAIQQCFRENNDCRLLESLCTRD